MKKPEPAPDYTALFSDAETFERIFRAEQAPELLAVLKKANADYLYWDRFKQIYNAAALPAEHAWAYLSFMRTTQMKKIALQDLNGDAFGYWVPDSFQKTLHELDQNASGALLVEDPAVYKESRERFIVSSIMEEAIASSQLEGAATTTGIAKEMLRTGRPPQDAAEQMIANNYAAMKILKNYIQEPLSKDMILKLQALLTKDIRDDESISGRFRTENDKVSVQWDDGTLLHLPPPAASLDERLELLCRFANSEDPVFIHPVVKAVILHFWLAFDHPFVDGNGRTARALFYWFMLKKGYWLMEYIAISRIIKMAPAQYAKAYLYSEAKGSDLTYFIHYHLGVIQRGIKDFQEYLNRKSVESHEAKIKVSAAEDLNPRQAQLLYLIMTEPMPSVTIRQHMNIFGITYETARTDLLYLADKGYIVRQKKGKQFIYVPDDKLKAKAR